MSAIYRFSSFELDPDQRRLLVLGQPATLGPRAFDVLVALVERAGQLVSKNQLLDLVWAGLVVEENNLQVQISTLRKLLGPDVIATVPGRGYRLTVELGDAGPPEQETAADALPARTASMDPPAEPEALYGRAADLAALSALAQDHKLVTVVGPAGIGKTRLAQTLAHALRTRFADGVVIAEFAPLVDPSLIVVTVARALGLVASDSRSALELAGRALAGRRLLLVLDNCEHLLDDVAHLVAALRKDAPDVHILATSQEILRHPDEHVYRLGALALPTQVTVSGARETGAIQLFVARAQAAEPRFLLTEENVGAVVEICRRLDGIPLAIELAAARVPLLGAEGVRERLGERFRLLTMGSRMALRRHQTLRAALEWSYNLLSEPEQAVFEQLGVFADSFSLESAQAVAVDNVADEWAALDHLGALIDKSLVAVEGTRAPRYRMLETTRAFAAERLAARGATLPAMRRHAKAMLDLFERAHEEVRQGTPSAKVTERIAPDLENLRGALHWAAGADGDHRIAIALFGAAVEGHGYFFYAPLKARQWIEMLRPLVDASITAPDAARFWLACADWGALHSPRGAVHDARRAIAIYRNLDDPLGSCRAWTTLTYSLLKTGQLHDAKRALDETLRLRDPEWAPWLRALVDNMAALVLSSLGELRAARRHAAAFLEICRQMCSDVDQCLAQTILIDLDVAAGDTAEAAAAARELVAHQPALWKETEDGQGLRIVATALMSAGALDEAEPLYREALSRLRRYYGSIALVSYEVAMFLALSRRLDDAARLLAYADRVYTGEPLSARLVARQTRDRLLGFLAEQLAPDALSRLHDEGRRLSDADAGNLASCALATPA